MFNYNGCTCDKCGEAFDLKSDVVVCPECGTPHHRHCWKELGHCTNEAKHAEGFVWAAPEKAVAEGMHSCPKCHTQNPTDTAFCESCGTQLEQKSTSFMPSFSDFKSNAAPAVSTLPKALAGEQDGVSFKDMAIYIGTTSPYYIFKFRRKQSEGKAYNPFCWSAALFGSLYFLYRKMWAVGILCELVAVLISMPANILLAVQLGILAPTSPLLFTGIETAAAVLSLVMLAVRIAWGFIAVPLYQKKVTRELRTLKKVLPNEKEYYETLVRKSGPSKAVMIVSLTFAFIYMLY